MKRRVLFFTIGAILGLLFGVISAHSKTLHLDENNTIALVGEINENVAQYVFAKLTELNKTQSKDTIYFLINSPGGYTLYAEVILQFVQQSPRLVETISINAASVAFNLVQEIKGKRYLPEYGVLMTHNMSIPMLQINQYTTEAIANIAKIDMESYKKIADRLKMTLPEYLNFMNVATHVRGENNIKINTADEIVTIDCSKGLILSGGCPR